MKKQLLTTVFIVFFLFSVIVVPAYCQTVAPDEATPTEEAPQTGTTNWLLIGGIIAVVAVVAAVAGVVVVKKKSVSEKRLQKYSSRQFEEWVIKKFNGKPADPASGVNGYTEGGQPLLIIQSDHVSLAEVEDFVKLLVKGKAQKGTIVAFKFESDTLEGKVTALDNGIALELLPTYELLNKRYAKRIRNLASAPATFEASAVPVYTPEEPIAKPKSEPMLTFEKRPSEVQGEFSAKPRVFISNSNTKVADQVKRMLEFIHYDYVMGDKEETTVPISEGKFGIMKECDCAIINIAAVEQERRYSGLYILNPNVLSEINAAYLKYDTQVILLVERKIDLPANLKGLKRIEYDSDDLSFNAAMDLNSVLGDFRKL
ncbi:MAG: LPXTG cell wall anchor domain-containing protein [Candidatus Bathyarchaeota archaeon]|nr:LPXTG cell wall anchor domain-containing protein [Candidatus Bathyarchaeota archaeon]